LQFSDRGDYGCSNVNFVSTFSQNGGSTAPKFAFLEKTVSDDKKISRNFSTGGGGNCCALSTCHDATDMILMEK